MEISTVRGYVRTLINDMIRIDGRDVYTFDTNLVFNISESFPDSDTIIVKKNGDTLLETDWDYNSDTNEITIDIQTSGEECVRGDVIEISYSYYAKYSNDEIDGYIQGTLLYFTEFRFPKCFVIEDTEIVSVNDSDPTTEESHIIALVTAIHINPDNITLRTPDFTRTAAQFKSKKEQISEVITRYQRFIGQLSFLEDEQQDV